MTNSSSVGIGTDSGGTNSGGGAPLWVLSSWGVHLLGHVLFVLEIPQLEGCLDSAQLVLP